MTAAQLFRLARERFLVSNEAALRSHLTEFRDHHLLATRCGSPLQLCCFWVASPLRLSETQQNGNTRPSSGTTTCWPRGAAPHYSCAASGWPPHCAFLRHSKMETPDRVQGPPPAGHAVRLPTTAVLLLGGLLTAPF